jgi:hypothetical protein
MTDQLRKILSDEYGIQPDSTLRQDQRGMMNDTWFVAGDFVMTVFRSRPPLSVALIAAVVQNDESRLWPQIIAGKNGPVSLIEGKAAIMWQRLSGNHYVGRDHSNKIPIPAAGHASIADSFWRLHASLEKSRKIGPWLGQMNYIAPAAQGLPDISFAELPSCLHSDYIAEYLRTPTLPLHYPAFVHRDFERQNVLNAPDGKVVGVVDSDALMMGDLLFEYAHCMMNFVFSDPQYQHGYADLYLKSLEKAGIVSDKDKELLPVLIRAFAAKDLVDYYRYDHPPKTDLSRLAAIYDMSLERVDSYFAGLSPHVAMRPRGHARRLKPPAPDDGV